MVYDQNYHNCSTYFHLLLNVRESKIIILAISVMRISILEYSNLVKKKGWDKSSSIK
jgi:hypothetical protein